VAVVRRLQHGGSSHFVIEQSDGTRALLPAWMTEPWAAQVTIVERPRLPLEALYALRSTIIGALLSLSPATPMREGSDDRLTGRQLPARSARARGKHAGSEPDIFADSNGSDVSAKKVLMAEHIAADVALPLETANE
jgi:hypothetical protein